MTEEFSITRQKAGIACLATICLLLLRQFSGGGSPLTFEALLAGLVVLFCGSEIHKNGLGGFFRTQVLRPSLLYSLGTLGALIQSLLQWTLNAPRPGFEIPVLTTTVILIGNLTSTWVWSKLQGRGALEVNQLPPEGEKWKSACDVMVSWFLPSTLVLTGFIGISQFIATGYAPKALTAMVALLLGFAPQVIAWAVRAIEVAINGLQIPLEHRAFANQEIMDQVRFNVGVGILGNFGILITCSLRFVTPLWAAISHEILILICLLGAWKLRRDLESDLRIKSEL